MEENGNGELTRATLRAEIRAARAEDKLEFFRALDERLGPVNAHIAAIDRGELSEGLKAGILSVLDEQTRKNWMLRSSKTSVFAGLLVLGSFVLNVAAFTILHT